MPDEQPEEISPSAAQLFATVWDNLTDILGSAATATLIRRGAKVASAQFPELQNLVVARKGFEYSYTVPDAWTQSSSADAVDALRSLATALGPLLVELTGSVVVRRLATDERLLRNGVLFQQEL